MENIILESSNQLLISFSLFISYLISLSLNFEIITLLLFVVIVLVNVFLFVYIIFFSNRDSKKSYLLKKSYNDYKENTKNLTKSELEKLFKNPKFIELYKERGPDTTKWCWQNKENRENNSEIS